jgi:hypothetical protein
VLRRGEHGRIEELGQGGGQFRVIVRLIVVSLFFFFDSLGRRRRANSGRRDGGQLGLKSWR